MAMGTDDDKDKWAGIYRPSGAALADDGKAARSRPGWLCAIHVLSSKSVVRVSTP